MTDLSPQNFPSTNVEPAHDASQHPLTDVALSRAISALAAITASLQEDGTVLDKTYDDLRHELGAWNDGEWEGIPPGEEVTLLSLLQASTARLNTAPDHITALHIHHLIECAFLEQEAHRAIETLWRETRSTVLTPDHLALLDAATREYLSDNGKAELQALAAGAAQKERLPDYRASSFLQCHEDEATPGGAEAKAAFFQSLRYLETITDHLMDVGFLWERTPPEVAQLLADQNASGRQEAEQQGRPYTPTTLAQLEMLAHLRRLAFHDTGWHLTHYGRVIRVIDGLIKQASALESGQAPSSAPSTLKTADTTLSGRSAVVK